MKNKKYVIMEIFIYIIIAIILAYPIAVKVKEKEKYEKLNNDILSYVNYINKNVTKKDDGEYYKKIDKFKNYKINLSNEEYIINNGNVYKGSFCYEGYQVDYLNNNITFVGKGCNDSSQKIKNAKIEVTVEDLNKCTKSKKINIKYDDIKGAKLEYKLHDFDGNLLIDWTIIDKELTINQNGILVIRLNNGYKTSKEKKYNIINIDNLKLNKNKPIISKIKDNEVVIENSMTNDIEDDICNIDSKTIEYGYSTTKNGKYIYQKNNKIKVDLNKDYYFKTRANDTANNGIVESKPIKISKDQKCIISYSDSETLTKIKIVTIVSKINSQIKYKIGEQEWANYDGQFEINRSVNKSNPLIISCLSDEKENYIKLTGGIDSELPSVPQIKLFVGKVGKNNYKLVDTDNLITSEDVRVELISNDDSNIDHYEYSHDLIHWNYISNRNRKLNDNKNFYWINWNGGWWYYYRAVDEAGNVSEPSNRVIINVKK